jgi:hypothetical protein
MVVGTFAGGAEVDPAGVLDVVGSLVGEVVTTVVVVEVAAWVWVVFTPGLGRAAANALIGVIAKAPMTATALMRRPERRMGRSTPAKENT